MDAEYKTFQKYFQFHEGSLEPSSSRQWLGSDVHLQVAALVLLSLPKGESSLSIPTNPVQGGGRKLPVLPPLLQPAGADLSL